MFERILVPLDGSEGGEAVLKPLRRLLTRTDAEVVLFQAVHLPPMVNPEHAGSILSGMECEAVDYLERHRGLLRCAAIRARTLVVSGPPAKSILKAAESQDASLIALSTHGRSGVARWVLGSVTEVVMRHSPVPVFVARTKAPLAPAGSDGMNTILVPFDGRESSLAIAPAVIEMARLFHARVAVLKVEDGMGNGAGEGFVGHLMEGPVRLEGRPDLLDRDLIEAGNPFAEAGLRTTVFRVRGDVAAQINHLARILPASLIAMATHGRAGVSRLVSGSITEQVVRNADVPALVFRCAAAAKQEALLDRRVS